MFMLHFFFHRVSDKLLKLITKTNFFLEKCQKGKNCDVFLEENIRHER